MSSTYSPLGPATAVIGESARRNLAAVISPAWTTTMTCWPTGRPGAAPARAARPPARPG